MNTLTTFGPWAVGVAIVIATLVWKWDRKGLVAFYDAHTTAHQRATIASDLAILKPLAEDGVLLAEQQFPGLPGAEKFIHATEHVITVLHDHGLTPNPALVHGAVQAAYAQVAVDGRLAASASKAPAASTPTA